MNQKLDHLREVLTQSKKNAIVSQNTSGPKRKRKRVKEPSDDESSVGADEENKAVPSGILVDKPHQRKSAMQLFPPKHVRFDKSSFYCEYTN